MRPEPVIHIAAPYAPEAVAAPLPNADEHDL